MRITFPDTSFSDWPALHRLVTDAYAYMDGRIDPPSSATRMSVEDYAQKARDEWLLTGVEGDELLACAFVAPQGDAAYIGKVAVRGDRQGQGLFRQCYVAIERTVRDRGFAAIELKVRVELTEVRAVYERLGFRRVADNRHEGYDRTTNITMRKELF